MYTTSTTPCCPKACRNYSRRRTMSMMMYDESVRRTQARIRQELFLGRGKHTRQLYYLQPDEYLATHTHLVGASNFGKSFYLEHLLRSYTELRIPASLIDPHGDQAEHYYQFLQRMPRLTRQHKIIHFKPGSAAGDAGFNPFRWNLQPGVIAGLMLEAFMKAWGQQSFNETPLLERVLHNMFHVFAVNRLPLTECHQFLLAGNRSFRDTLVSAVADERVRADWREIEDLPKFEKATRFESSRNRLQRFFVEPAVE